MRPARFLGILSDLLQQDSQVKEVTSAHEIGYDKYPYALAVTYQTGARVLLQIATTSAEGDDFSQPEQIIEGNTAPAPVAVPDLYDGGRLQLARVDEHLAALVLNSGSREIKGAEVYSSREKAGAVQYGVTLHYHDKSKIYVFVAKVLPAGRELSRGQEYQDVPAAV